MESYISAVRDGVEEQLVQTNEDEGFAVNDITMHIQTSICTLLQERTGSPIILLRPSYAVESPEPRFYSVAAIRFRRFRCFTIGTLAQRHPRAYIETLFNHEPTLPHDDSSSTWIAGVYGVVRTNGLDDLSLSSADMRQWMRDWQSSEAVNRWVDAVGAL